ncbi:hypothetical protein ACLB2K_074997 [Fragaria x ananassa]
MPSQDSTHPLCTGLHMMSRRVCDTLLCSFASIETISALSRHFVTARIYGSEAALGIALTDAIQDRTVERENFFVTSICGGLEAAVKKKQLNVISVHLMSSKSSVGVASWSCIRDSKGKEGV